MVKSEKLANTKAGHTICHRDCWDSICWSCKLFRSGILFYGWTPKFHKYKCVHRSTGSMWISVRTAWIDGQSGLKFFALSALSAFYSISLGGPILQKIGWIPNPCYAMQLYEESLLFLGIINRWNSPGSRYFCYLDSLCTFSRFSNHNSVLPNGVSMVIITDYCWYDHV